MSLASHAYLEIFVSVVIDNLLASQVEVHCHACVGMTGRIVCMRQVCMHRAVALRHAVEIQFGGTLYRGYPLNSLEYYILSRLKF